MRELGQFLRARREALGMDLDEVQEKTKIRKRYLSALENGDWSILPGYVYGRGFVRSYSEILGLDGLELLNRYADEPSDGELPSATDGPSNIQPKQTQNSRQNRVVTGQNEAVENRSSNDLAVSNQGKQANVQHRGASRERVPSKATRLLSGRKFNVISQVAVVVGVLGLISGGLYVLKHNNQPNPAQHGQNSVAFGSQNGATQGTGFANQTNTTGLGTMNSTYDQSTTPLNSTSGAQSVGSASIIPAAFQNNVQNYTVVTSQPLSVSLSAMSGDCWVKVSGDSRVIDNSDMINQGTKKSWTANNTLTVRVGNVSAVQIQVNGQSVQLPSATTAIDVTFIRQQTQSQ